jgi:hypothetical protein
MPTAQQKQSEFVERAMELSNNTVAAAVSRSPEMPSRFSSAVEALRAHLESHAQQQAAVVGALVEAAREDAMLLDALAQPGFELSRSDDPEVDPELEWNVHCVSGGRNDREWTLIAEGWSPREAIRRAMKLKPRSAEPEILAVVTEMAYVLKLVPRGDVVPVVLLDLLKKQHDAALKARAAVTALALVKEAK